MKLCPNCGKLNEDFAGTCSQCGSLLNSSDNNSEREYNAYVSVNEQHMRKPTVGNSVIGTWNIVIPVCLLLWSWYYTFNTGYCIRFYIQR